MIRATCKIAHLHCGISGQKILDHSPIPPIFWKNKKKNLLLVLIEMFETVL